MVITFHFLDNDYCNYSVLINNKSYDINQDNHIINIEETCKQLNVTLSYKQEKISFIKIICALFLELIKIPLLVIFETIPNNAWYENISLNDFSYSFTINTNDKDKIDINLKKSILNYDTFNYSLPEISSEIDIKFENKSINNNLNNLKMKLLKYCFKLFWLTTIIVILLILAIKNSIFISILIVGVLCLMIVLIGKAIYKYKQIKNKIENLQV